MRVVVLGAGGLGSVIGGYLADTGVEVTLVGRPAHVEAINRHGLRITGRRGKFHVRDHLRAVSDPADASGEFDYLILAVKAKDSARALADAAPIRDSVAVALSVQNTVEKDQRLAEWLGPDRVLGASTIEGGHLVEPGLVNNHVTTTVTAHLGEPDGTTTPRLTALVEAFNTAGLSTAAVSNIHQVQWEKLAQIGLAASWSVTAVGALPERSFAEGLATATGAQYWVTLAKEILSVYRAMGYTPQNFYAPISKLQEMDRLGFDEAVEMMREQGRQLARYSVGRPSMYEDVVRRRRTEVDYMLPPYLEAAKQYGIDVPTLRTAYLIVKTIDELLE
ncbi:MAG: ketopantoate reductase family protein [Pseudonocardia sp.]